MSRLAGFSSFRKSTWDPLLILSQIVALQCYAYASFSFIMIIARFLTNIQLGPQLLFDSKLVRGDTVEGWIIGGGLVGMGLANIVPLVYLVERSRLCIDFSLTFFTIHLVLTWCHQRWPPTTLLWWLVVGVSGSVMALGGRAACLRRELLPIAIRNFMPSHPREQTARDLGTEEMELETRDARLAAPEVLFDSLQADGMPEEDAPSQLAKNARGSDEWGNDNWGEEDDGVTKPDNVPRAPNAPPGLASSQQHQQQQQPAISPAAPSSSSRPPPAPKGGKDD